MKFWLKFIGVLVICNLAFLIMSCATEEKIDELPYNTRVKMSTVKLKEGRTLLNRLMTRTDRKAEDSEKVIAIWKEGLEILPVNTQIRHDLIVLLYSMAAKYVLRKSRYFALADRARRNGDDEKKNSYLEKGLKVEKKALDTYQRVVNQLDIFENMRPARDPKEEWKLFNFKIISYIYLERYRTVLQLLDKKILRLPDDSPKLPKLKEMRRAVERTMNISKKN